MQRYTFSTFSVDAGNREAHEVCRATADLKPLSSMPVVLLGDDGCGKTHLLYSVVNQIRSGAGKTGLAYVTAREFPEKVRALIKDPAPVQRASSAILMVDQLEKFTERLEELEAVVRIFLDNKHYVLMASSVHPDRLNNLPFGLRGLIKKGRTIRINGRIPGSEPTAPLERSSRPVEPLSAVASHAEERNSTQTTSNNTRLAELEAELRQQREAHETLRAELTSAQSVVASARQELETLRKEHHTLKRDYETAQSSNDILRRDHDVLRRDSEKTQQSQTTLENENDRLRRNEEALRREIDAIREERTTLERRLQTLQTDANAVASLRSEVNGMRDEFARLDKERESLAREAARSHELEDELEALRRAETELRRQLVIAREEAQIKETDANRLVDRAHSILSQVEEHRVRFVETEERQRDQIHSLESMLAQQSSSLVNLEELETAIRDREVLQTEFDNARREWSAAREQLTSMLHIAQRENTNLDEARKTALEKIGRLTAEHAAMQLELVEARDRLKDLDSAKKQLDDAAQKIIALPTLRQELLVAQEQIETLRRELAQANEKLLAFATLEDELTQTRDAASKLATAEKELAEAHEKLRTLQTYQEEVARLQQEAIKQQALVSEMMEQYRQQEAILNTLRTQASQAESLLAETSTIRNELETFRRDLEKAQETIRLQAIEMDALRLEAAAQVAAANAQAGDVEREYARLCAVMEQSRQTGSTATTMLGDLHNQMLDAANIIVDLASRLDQNTQTQMVALANAPAPTSIQSDQILEESLISLPGLEDGIFFETPKELLTQDPPPEIH